MTIDEYENDCSPCDSIPDDEDEYYNNDGKSLKHREKVYRNIFIAFCIWVCVAVIIYGFIISKT